MSKRSFLIAVAIAIIIVIGFALYVRYQVPRPQPARLIFADDRSYFEIVHNLLSSASESIDAILYQTRFYFDHPGSKSNILLCDLGEAAGLGVEVRVILEEADWNPSNSEENRDVYNVLAQSGVSLYFDPAGRTSHSKLVIIDGRYVIVGSTNWSHYSLDINNEANVVIESEAIADEFRHYFEGVLKNCSASYINPLRVVDGEQLSSAKDRYVVMKEVPDSLSYDSTSNRAWIFAGGTSVLIDEDALSEILAIDPDFFTSARDETLRALVRLGGREPVAVDVETRRTTTMMKKALGKEVAVLRKKSFPKPALNWIEDVLIEPVPNEKYAPRVKSLISAARKRIWVAMLDARYYEETPRTAKKLRPKGSPPSLTNLLLDELRKAVTRGVDVRVVCDMGWRGSPPPGKVAFLKSLSSAGAKAYEDPPEVTTHAKVAIFDNDITVIGSTNWTYHALEENNETAVVVRSHQVNAHYADYISRIIARSSEFRN